MPTNYTIEDAPKYTVEDAPATPPVTPPAATPAPNGGGLGAWTDKNLKGEGDSGWESPELGGMLAGAVKSGGQVVGNILDFFAKPHPIDPNAPPEQLTSRQAKFHQHLQDAANWLRQGSEPQGFWENVGATGEQVLEYIGTDGLLKMVGPGVKVAAAGGRAVETAEELKQAQQVATTLSKNPKIAGLVAIGLKASKDAALMAGQTYAHTEDPRQAAIAGVAGGTLGAAAGGLEAGGRYLMRNAPKTLDVAGEKISVMAKQLNKAGKAVEGGAGEAPEMAAEQQQGAKNVIRNLAQQATRGVLEKVNATRPMIAPMEGSGRLLEAPAGAEPFTFTLETTPANVGTTGEIAQSAAKVPGRAAFKEPQYTSASAPSRGATRPGGPHLEGQMGEGIRAAEGQTGADIRTAGAPEGQADVASGGGTLQTTDPHEAESWLSQLEDLQESPIHEKLSAADQARVEAQRQALEEQLGVYHASPYAKRFDPLDSQAAAGQVRTFGDAARQIQAAVKPVYETLDRASGGQFNKWNNAAKQAQKIMRSATTLDAADAAEARLAEANRNIDELLTRHAGDVSRTDYMAAREAWKASSRLGELHSVFERMMNGVTTEETDRGLTQVMTGRTKSLQNYLAKGENLDQIEKLIGREGVTNLKQITLLLSKANTARQTIGVAKEVGQEVARHLGRAGVGSLIGSIAGKMLGVAAYPATLAGAMAGEGARYVLRYAATNPRVGNMVEYAVRNGISPKVYAPLIARAIAEPFQQPQQPEAAAEGTQ